MRRGARGDPAPSPALSALPGTPPTEQSIAGKPAIEPLQVTVIHDPDAGVLVLDAMPYIASARDLTYSVLDALRKVLPKRISGRLPKLAWESTVS
ncbi:hypothetical protein [Nonomuraea zeae]|uniref:Uncharacterized protein n=1 Tax=Nonomuraea zeae TaxID=1642303 RepID=A0A5S4GXZ7_9ACTN|nr:hypothetical protein [Nonomuraea zeae]TMR37334.1 hypothetical protein ETD85_08305 [Nonomuraea zeae]